MSRFKLVLLAAVALVFGAAQVSFAQTADDWPRRPVHIIVPSDAGSGIDLPVRVLFTKITQTMGPFIVENRPGASGIVGVQAGLNAAADGYTFIVVNDTHLSVAPFLLKDQPYDPLTDFTFVGQLLQTRPFLVVTSAKTGPATFQEFVQQAKNKPGSFYGTVGVGSSMHIGFEVMARRLGVKMEAVAYSGTTNQMNAVVQGETLLTAGSQAGPLIDQGLLRAIAIGGATRLPEFPNVPTMMELTGAEIFPAPVAWAVAKAGTPKPIIDKLTAAIKSALDTQEVAEAYKRLNLVVAWEAPEVMTERSKRVIPEYRALIKELNLGNR